MIQGIFFLEREMVLDEPLMETNAGKRLRKRPKNGL